MAPNRESLSAQSKRRTNYLLLVFGLVIALLFLLAWCRMQPKQETQVIRRDPGDFTVEPIDSNGSGEIDLPNFNSRGDAQLIVTPSEVIMTPNVVIGSEAEAPIVLRAKNAPIRLISKKLIEEQPDGFVLSGSCMEKERLPQDEECTINVSWTPKTLRNIQNTLVIEWREHSPSVFQNERTTVALKAQSTDSKDCVICCEEKEKEQKRPEEGMDLGGKSVDPNNPDTEKTQEGLLKDKKTGEVKGITEPKKIPLDLKNELMGDIASNGDVINSEGKVVGRLLNDNTIMDPTTLKIVGKAIYAMPAMNEQGNVVGKLVINDGIVAYADAKGSVVGYPRVDGQVVDANKNAVGFIAPWGAVIDSMGNYVGLIMPDGSVVNESRGKVAFMRPMGFAVNDKGELVGGVVPRGVGVGAGGRSLGEVKLNGEVKDSFDQTVGHVLLDRSIVDSQMNELGSVIREGVVIDEEGTPIGFVNSEGKVLNFKATQIGVMNPDGMAFAHKTFVGALMPEGLITSGGCTHAGAVYPDGSVVNLSLKKLGHITPDGKAVDDKKRQIGAVVPWGTAIAEGCRLLGLISLNGDVVSMEGVKNGCVNPDKTVQNLQGDISGEVTPLGLYVNAQNQVIGRVRLDGQIMDNKGQIIGCVYEKKLQVLSQNTRGVIVDENGYPLGGTSVGNKAYDENGNWLGDVYFNGWVIGDKGQLKGVVPFSGTVFSDSGKILGQYNQLTGNLKDKSGAHLGRVLPGFTVINPTGTEILGKLIPEGSTFIKLDGSFLGTLNTNGILIGPDAMGNYTIHANGSVTDKEGQLVGALVPVGPVLSSDGKYVGFANNRAEILDNRQIKIGRVLTNGLAISDKNQIVGQVISSVSVGVSVQGFVGSVEPKLSGMSGDLAYQFQVNDIRGNFIGPVSGTGLILGQDNTIKGRLISLAPFVNKNGKLVGWTNFHGELNAPDGRMIGTILPSGEALDLSQNSMGNIVNSTVVVDPMGEYLGTISSQGDVLSGKGEQIAIIGNGPFLYDADGAIIGQILKPGIAIDTNGQLMGWLRADGKIENGTRVLGSVGLDGHVFDVNGQMVGRFLTLGTTAFNDATKSVGFIGTSGEILEANGLRISQTGFDPYVASKGVIIGLEKTSSPFVSSIESGRVLGIVSETGAVVSLGSDKTVGSVMMNRHYFNTSNQLAGGMLSAGAAIMPTLGMIGTVASDGQIYKAGKKTGIVTGTGLVYSPNGELMGGVYPPNVLIDKRGSFAGVTSGTAAVYKSGIQIGNKMAFKSALSTDNIWLGNTMPQGGIVDDVGTYYGVVSTTDGTVVGDKNVFAGRVLPDGSVAGVPEKAVFNSMPYAGHTIQQGLPIGLNQGFKVVGRTTLMGDVVDNAAKKLFRIIDNAYVVNKSGQKPPVVARVFPIMSAVSNEGEVMGILSADGTIVSYQGEVRGRVDNAGLIRLNDAESEIDELRIQGLLIPEGLVVNDCKIVGQTAYDGRVINGQGSVVGRIGRDMWAVDANGSKIGRVVRNNEPCISGKQLMGRTLPDSTVVDLNGVEIGCATNSGEMLAPNGEKLCTIVERGVIIDDRGNIVGWTRWDGTIFNGESNIGQVDETGTAFDWDGNKIGINVGGQNTIFSNSEGVVKYIQRGDDMVLDNEGNELFKVSPSGQSTDPWGNQLPNGLNPYIPSLGYLSGCDLVGYDGQKIASLMADGTLRDENGDLVYTVTPDGQVFAPDGNYVETFRGFDISSALKQCGMSGMGKSDRPTRSISIGSNTYSVNPDGTITDEAGMIIGYLGDDGRPYTWDNKVLTDPVSGNRERPDIASPFKPTQAQIDDFTDKINKRRQGMKTQRERGAGTLKISAKIKEMAKPKKDKDWTKAGVSGKSISTWPVDMTHVVLQGKAIPAVLARSIDSRYSDVPAIAIVETNIYGEEGRNILIPAGSRLIGTFGGGSEGVEQQNGVAKLQIAWNRLIRPDGVAFDLEGANSGDAQGRGGVAAYLDEQLWNKYGTSVLSTLATSAVSYMMATNDDVTTSSNGSSSDSTGSSNRSQAMNQARKNFIDQIGEILEQMIEKAKDTPPVIFVPAGTRLTVFPAKDLWLRTPEDDADYMDKNPPKEEDDSEYQAKTPQGINSWTQQRRSEQDEKTPTSSNTEAPSNSQQEMETPLYDGRDRMPDISDRKVVPVPLEEEPLF